MWVAGVLCGNDSKGSCLCTCVPVCVYVCVPSQAPMKRHSNVLASHIRRSTHTPTTTQGACELNSACDTHTDTHTHKHAMFQTSTGIRQYLDCLHSCQRVKVYIKCNPLCTHTHMGGVQIRTHRQPSCPTSPCVLFSTCRCTHACVDVCVCYPVDVCVLPWCRHH